MREGWVKIHRKICDWEWYKEPNTMHLFLHLLLNANREPKPWRGNNILAGQLITGRETLAANTGLTVNQIRTSLERLKSTSEITVKIHPKYSLITIVKWEDYQTDNDKNHQQEHQQTTSKPPANHQQEHHKQEEKKDKKEKKEKNKPLPLLPDEPKSEYDEKLDQFIEHRAAMKKKMTPQAVKLFKRRLNTLHTKGYDVLELIDKAILNGWQDVWTGNQEDDRK